MRLSKLSALGCLLLAVGCDSDSNNSSNTDAGQTTVGGQTAGSSSSTASTNKTGGATSTSTASAGGGSSATGGASSAGGGSSAGGASSTSTQALGGAPAGGTDGTGGAVVAGGTSSTSTGSIAGSTATGGAITAGGTSSTSTGSAAGGVPAGGTDGTGGTNPIGGTAPTGGTSSTSTGTTTGGVPTGGTDGTGGSTTGGTTAGGAGGAGGTVTDGGTGAVGGTTITGGTTGVPCTVGVPKGDGCWTCDPNEYDKGDNRCDCGCGVHDPDCDDVAVSPPPNSSCANANSPSCCTTFTLAGSCAPLANESPRDAIDHSDNSKCAAAPAGWACSYWAYDDYICDCGCGALDTDDCYGSSNSSDCLNWNNLGACSQNSLLNPVQADNNALCLTTVPDGWLCDYALYHDGECNCGCGVPDDAEDCTQPDRAECDWCNDAGSCATATGNGCDAISNSDNSRCLTTEWTCSIAAPNDGTCDCGCGMADPDCTSSTSITECANCGYPGSCAATCTQIDPTNTGTCKE